LDENNIGIIEYTNDTGGYIAFQWMNGGPSMSVDNEFHAYSRIVENKTT